MDSPETLTRREFLQAAAAAPLLTVLPQGGASRPNVIWYMADEHRAQALSGYGDPNVKTPNLDRMIGASRTAIAGCPLCSPFRGSMLTSRYPHHCITGHDNSMPPGLLTIGGTFKGAGYRTAYFGKWHVDGAEHRPPHTRPGFQFVPPERRGGFDCWIGYENNTAPYDCWVHGNDEKGNPVPRYKLPGYETDSLTDLLLDYIKRQDRSQPFFAVVSGTPPHPPYIAPPDYTARHRSESVRLRPNVPPVRRVTRQSRDDLAHYYAMIEDVDQNVGRVFELLRSSGLANDTIVMYFSDHGDMHGSQGRILKCVPWEESIRTPFLVARGTGEALPKIREDTPDLLNHVDILPTTLGICGIGKPAGMEGLDYSGYFVPGRPVPSVDSAYLELVDPGYRWGFAADRERPWRGVVTRDGWKYAVLEGQPWLLYNLNEDPFETDNLAVDGRFHVERQRMQDLLADWIHRTGDAFRLPDISWRYGAEGGRAVKRRKSESSA